MAQHSPCFCTNVVLLVVLTTWPRQACAHALAVFMNPPPFDRSGGVAAKATVANAQSLWRGRHNKREVDETVGEVAGKR